MDDLEKEITGDILMRLNMSLAGVQRMFRDVYGERNERLYDSENLLLRVFEETAVIAEIRRKEDHDGLGAAIAGFFGWLLGFCNNEGIDLARAIFSKYHGCCPNCGRKRHCICISAETKPTRWHSARNAAIPHDLPEWQEMFYNIYGRVNRIAGLDKCWEHLLEELGEVSKAFRLKERRNLCDELADAFAWLAAVCNNSKVDLQQVVLARYSGRCDKCGKAKCRCPKV